MSQPSPFHSPTVTGRSSALFCAFTTQTKCPFALCCTARCGTTTALGRMEPVRRTRTYWLGRSTPAGLFTVARNRKVPVVGLYDGSANVIAPVYGKRLPSTISTSTMNLPPSGSFNWPARTSLRMRSISFSEMLKLIHIGVSTETVVSCEFGRAEVGAVGHQRVARHAVDRRAYRRIGKVELRGLELRLRLLHGGLRLRDIVPSRRRGPSATAPAAARAAWCDRGSAWPPPSRPAAARAPPWTRRPAPGRASGPSGTSPGRS